MNNQAFSENLLADWTFIDLTWINEVIMVHKDLTRVGHLMFMQARDNKTTCDS